MIEEEADNSLSNEEDKSDFSSLNKYFKDDDLIKKTEPVKVKTITEDVSISEPYSKNYEYDKDAEEIDLDDINKSIKKELNKDSKIVSVKKEFIKSLEDDSLTLDICKNINRDWNRK